MGFLNAFGALGRFLVAAALVAVAAAFLFGSDARTALLIVALSIGIPGLVFVGIGTRLGHVSGLDKSLRVTGVAGTATIASLAETGITVNGSPIVEFGLEVDTTPHAPYAITIRQRTPRLLLGAFLPGATVAILVDSTNREHLAIDWEAATDVGSRPTTSTVTTPAATDVRDVEELLREGRRATALITSMEDAGDMSELGLVEVGAPGDDDRLFIIGLEVKQAGMSAYDVRVAHRIPERLLGRVGPRSRVDVAVDRDDDHVVAIDWTSVRH
ncbi:MAG: hypothetical protein IH941_13110 [Acidobacteria bacterium]|nr:hypothetical protein [Acidobacteriota bacterium]